MVAIILVALGFGHSSGVAVADGLRLATEMNAHIIFVHVVTAFDLPIIEAPARAYLTSDELQAGLSAAAATVFAAAMAQARAQGVKARCAAISGVSIAQPLSDFACKQGCELIVAGCGARSLWRRLFGSSVAKSLADIANVPIWVSGRHPWRDGGSLTSRRPLTKK